MGSVKGQAAVKRFLSDLPEALAKRVLRGAARAAATVVADEAKSLSLSQAVAKAITVKTLVKDGRVVAKVQVKGRAAFIAPWLEYGTSQHFLSLPPGQLGGVSIGRANARLKDGTLKIDGQFIAGAVIHPGARPHPFLRPALDTKEAEAIAAAQSYVTARVGRRGMTGSEEQE